MHHIVDFSCTWWTAFSFDLKYSVFGQFIHASLMFSASADWGNMPNNQINSCSCCSRVWRLISNSFVLILTLSMNHKAEKIVLGRGSRFAVSEWVRLFASVGWICDRETIKFTNADTNLVDEVHFPKGTPYLFFRSSKLLNINIVFGICRYWFKSVFPWRTRYFYVPGASAG